MRPVRGAPGRRAFFAVHGRAVEKPPRRPRSAGHPIPKRVALWYGVRRRGKMALVTFAETKVTRARGETHIENNIAGGDTK